MIIELIEKYKNEIMEYTLGDQRDEYDELYSNRYRYEWRGFKDRIEADIYMLKPSQIELTPEILTYLIINQWRGVWCDEEDLNIDKLRDLSKTIMEEMK